TGVAAKAVETTAASARPRITPRILNISLVSLLDRTGGPLWSSFDPEIMTVADRICLSYWNTRTQRNTNMPCRPPGSLISL
ncbi:MAG: hypothetical protein AB7U66_17295, partial [Hyphomicrobiaceae bacterium]